VSQHLACVERRSPAQAISAPCDAIELARAYSIRRLWIERTHVLEHAGRDIGLIEPRAIAVDEACRLTERLQHARGVGSAALRFEQCQRARRDHREPDAITARDVETWTPAI